MNDIDNEHLAPSVRLRRHYLPFDEIAPGMVLGEPITLADRHVLRFSLPAGHTLTETNLRQLAVHHAEFVCVALPDQRSEEQIAADVAAASARVKDICAGGDLVQPALAALYERVLAFRMR